MSDEPKLPDPINRALELTFTRPPIVISASPDGSEINLRNGAAVQVTHEIEETFGYDVAQETPFRIIATSRIVFGGHPMSVLDDKSEPTAADYLARVGARTLVAFRQVEQPVLTKLHGRPVYRTYRSFLTLP